MPFRSDRSSIQIGSFDDYLASGGYIHSIIEEVSLYPGSNEPQTVCFWFNDSTTSYKMRESFYNALALDSSAGIQLGVRYNTDTSAMDLSYWQFGYKNALYMTKPALNEWHHFAYMFDGTYNKICLDSVTCAYNDKTNVISDVRQVQICGNQWKENTPALLEDMRVYNRALSNNELLTINTIKGHDGIYDGLISRWSFIGKSDGTMVSANEVVGLMNNFNNMNFVDSVGSDYTYIPDSPVSYGKRSSLI